MLDLDFQIKRGSEGELITFSNISKFPQMTRCKARDYSVKSMVDTLPTISSKKTIISTSRNISTNEKSRQRVSKLDSVWTNQRRDISGRKRKAVDSGNQGDFKRLKFTS